MIYVLNYVNLDAETINMDIEFERLSDLTQFVLINYPSFTSYQVIATRRNAERITKS